MKTGLILRGLSKHKQAEWNYKNNILGDVLYCKYT